MTADRGLPIDSTGCFQLSADGEFSAKIDGSSWYPQDAVQASDRKASPLINRGE